MNVEESNMIPNGRSIWVQRTQWNMSRKDHGLTSMSRVTKIRVRISELTMNPEESIMIHKPRWPKHLYGELRWERWCGFSRFL